MAKWIVKLMAVEVVLAAGLAMCCPAAVKACFPTTLVPWLLGVVMFGMGLTLQPKDFAFIWKRPWEVLVGTVAQFAIMPLAAFALVKLFHLSPEIALGVVLVGCCPGGTASNVICYLAGGDVALSVALTTMSTLLAPVVTPLLVWWLAGATIEVKAAAMFLSIVKIVLLPVLVGLVANVALERRLERVKRGLPAFSTLVVVLIVAIVVAASADKLWDNLGILLAVVVAHNLLGLALGYAAGLLTRSPKTVAIEVGMQNSGLAVSLAAMHFASQPLAAIPGAIFSVWHNISGSLFANLMRALPAAKHRDQ